MAKRMAERRGADPRSDISKAAKFHAEKTLQAKEEKLEEERRTSQKIIKNLEDDKLMLEEERRTRQKRIKNLEDDKLMLEEERRTSQSKIKNLEDKLEEERKKNQRDIQKLEDKILVLKPKLATEQDFLKKERIKCNKLSDQLAKAKKDSVKEFERIAVKLKTEDDTRTLEETFRTHRQPAATRKDVQEVCTDLLSSQHTSYKQQQMEFERSLLDKIEKRESLKKEFDKERERLLSQISDLKENAALLEDSLKTSSKCQEDAQTCKLLRKECKKLKTDLESAEYRKSQIDTYVGKLRQEIELKDREHAAQLRSRVCRQCAVLANEISDLKGQLDRQTTQLRGCSKKSTSLQQSDLCEDLHLEYGKVVTGFKVLQLVECHFKDRFEAKGFLCDIFIDCYEKCKERLMEIVCKNVGELFQVQTEDHRNDAMEDLSHAFWQLLQTTGMKLMLTKAQIRSDIQIKVEENIPELQRFKKAEGDIAAVTEKLPLDQFVKLAWKFVTQPYPVIVCTPERCKMDDEIHKASISRWVEEEDSEQPVIYSQPVVYRSYHGEVLVKGLVGNVP